MSTKPWQLIYISQLISKIIDNKEPLKELKSTISSSLVVSPMVAVGNTSTFVDESNSKLLRSEWDFKWNDNKLLVPASSHAEDTLVKKGSTLKKGDK